MIDRETLEPMQVDRRIPRLREELPGAGCEAMLVTHLTNIRYLTGFSGSAALLLLLPDEVLFVTDGRYRDQAGDELAAAGVEARIEIGSGGEQRAALEEATHGIATLGLEAESVSWAQHQSYSDEWFPETELVATEGLVERLRLVKDGGEIARVEAAAAIADRALDEVRGRLLEEPTERDFAIELDFTMRRLGAEDVSFDTIVASGPNGAKPHARPGDRRIVDGDLVVLDFGALLEGYHSDMTRTIAVGEPTTIQRRMLEVVLDAQQQGVEAVADGVEAAGVDAVCRKVIDDAGWGDAFLHSTGHGVGLDIHESPRVAATSESVLRTGEIVTVEPGIYLPEHGGVRIEDTVVVEDEGCRRVTRSTKLTSPR